MSLAAIIFLTLSCARAASATAPAICTDLYAESCAAGVQPDGTGGETEAGIQKSQAKVPAEVFKMIRTELSDDPDLAELVRSGSLDRQLSVEELLQAAVMREITPFPPGEAPRLPLKNMSKIVEKPTFQRMVQNAFNIKAKANRTPKRLRRVEEIFKKVKKLTIERLSKIPLSDADRKKMLAQIEEVEISKDDCRSMPELYFGEGAMMWVGNPPKIILCSGLLMQSEFQIAFTLAHELMHRVDLCMWGSVFGGTKYDSGKPLDTQHPLRPLLECLRDPNGVDAYRLRAERFEHGELNVVNCINSDQISEAMCDWMAGEVIPRYVERNLKHLSRNQIRAGYKNIWAASCKTKADQPDNSGDFSVHPLLRNRMNAVIAVQPDIRHQIGCDGIPAEKPYCDSRKAFTEQRSIVPPQGTIK